jgi:succinate-semialdehyde dehydrogenase/glutarate-semialdehyde dehydrogenase
MTPTNTTASTAARLAADRVLPDAVGSWIAGDFALTGRTAFDVVDPATGDVVRTVNSADVDVAIRAVDAAAEAGPAWAALPPRQRADLLHALYAKIVAVSDDLAHLISAENGKPLPEARGDVTYAADFVRWYAEEAARWPSSGSRSPGGTSYIEAHHVPVGVCLLITPWNVPAAMIARKLAPALAAGCTVVIKPAEDTPLTALALAVLAEEVGIPRGVVNVVTTQDPAPVVAAILKQSPVKKLSFTGSSPVGKTLLGLAAERVLRTSMELGGRAPFIVLPSADMDLAIESAMIAKMRNGGMSCVAADHFYVHASRVEEFTERLTARFRQVRVGGALDGLDPDLGPLVNARERQRVASLVDGWVARGARVLTGGTVPDGPGWFYPATVVIDLDETDRFEHEEVFGPVAPVTAFDDIDELLAQLARSDAGLSAYVLGSTDDARRVARRLDVGMVGINRGLVSDVSAPFGGVKESGLGREGSAAGLLDYLEPRFFNSPWN